MSAPSIPCVIPEDRLLTDVEYWSGKLNMSEVPRALLLTFFTGLTVPLSVNSSQTWIIKTFGSWALPLLVLQLNLR